ncbi:MAG: rhamnulokinase [Pararoseburia sp.]|nr:rhamnulokinase [Lachnospiraceae bacterium]MDY4794337.1 rhamnulokinase [Pararoseburia sp.]
MEKYYLAIDIGASSGRHILGHMEKGKMVLEEVYRFPNGIKEVDGEKVWDVDGLFQEVLTGMKRCKEQGKVPVSVGIDTWAVDFVLLDERDKRLGNAVAYRDSRTRGMDKLVYEKVPQEELYSTTGIQKQIFNSIYQLMALKEKTPELLEKATTFLMIPDYLNFLLSGVKAQEYTNATTTQLVNPDTRDWDRRRMEQLGFPTKIFLPIREPGSVIGTLKNEIREEVGFDCQVVLPATHDTGSAVVAVPSNDNNVLYISSGTWSLMGTELSRADCSKKAMEHNFTNEGGYNKTYRFLKNIMGLWMIQSVKKEIAQDISFGEICESASKCDIKSIVDANDDRFLAPENMTFEVQKACEESGQPVPQGIAEVAAVIYNSLAKCYGETLAELEEQTGCAYERIHVVGGGANAAYLNQLTAAYTGRKVFAGPTEATAIGNLAVQMIASGELVDLSHARKCIFQSFEIKEFNP